MGRGIQPNDQTANGLRRRGRGTIDPLQKVRQALLSGQGFEHVTSDMLEKVDFELIAEHIRSYNDNQLLPILRAGKSEMLAWKIAKLQVNFEDVIDYDDLHENFEYYDHIVIKSSLELMKQYFDRIVRKLPNYVDYEYAIGAAELRFHNLHSTPLSDLYSILQLPQHSVALASVHNMLLNKTVKTLHPGDFITSKVNSAVQNITPDQHHKLMVLAEEIVEAQLNPYKIIKSSRHRVSRRPPMIHPVTIRCLKQELNNIIENTYSLYSEEYETMQGKEFPQESLMQRFASYDKQEIQDIVRELEQTSIEPVDTDNVPYLTNTADDQHVTLESHKRLALHVACAYGVSFKQAVEYCHWLGKLSSKTNKTS